MNAIITDRKKFEVENRWVKEMRKFPDAHGFSVGDLVMIDFEYGSVLKSSARKLKRNWVGPYRIQIILDDTHYLVSDWSGQLLPKRFHINRLKLYHMNLGRMKEGKLETVTSTKELFRIWKELKEDKEILVNEQYTQTET